MRLLLTLFALLLATQAPARRAEGTIIHTTDLHGHILPTRDYDGHEQVGGLLKVATVVERIRAEHPAALLVDCGDLYQGGAESFLTDGRLMIKACEWLKYDTWCLGNHEFDWGLDKLAALHDATKLTMIGANIGARAGGVNRLSHVRPFVIKEVDGIKIAIVGLITPGVPSWSRSYLLGDQLFDDSLTALGRIMPAVRAESPDLIVLTTHQGLRPQDDYANEVRAIARAYPEIQFIIGGHSHRVVPDERIGSTLFTQAGYYGAWLGQLDIAYDTVERRLISATPRIHTIDASVPESAALRALCEADLERTQKYLTEKVGSSDKAFTSKADEFGQSPVQMLICRAVAAVADADIVLHGALAEDPLPAGELTMKDIWTVAPYENTIGVIQITPEQIAMILDENGAKPGAVHFMGAFGLHYDWEKQADGKRHAVRLRTPDGEPLHARRKYRVALHSYNLASGGRRFPVIRMLADLPESRLEMTGVDTRTALINYVKKNSPLKIEAVMEGARR